MGAWEGGKDRGSNGLCKGPELEVPGQCPSECIYMNLNLMAEVEAGIQNGSC